MYRLFAMDKCGRLYQFSRVGWAKSNGTNMTDVKDWHNFLRKNGTPALPAGQFIADLYIASVDASGMIITTFPAITTDAK